MRTSPIALSVLLASLALVSVPPARAEGEPDVRRSPVVLAVERARPGVVSIRTNEIVNVPRFYSWFEYENVPQEREGSLGTGVVFHPDGHGAHGLNERLEVRSLYVGRDYLFDLVKAYAD